MRRYEATVDPQQCTAAQMCVSIAPETFVYDADQGVSRAEGGPSEDKDALLGAAEMCPVEAITVRDVETGEQLYP